MSRLDEKLLSRRLAIKRMLAVGGGLAGGMGLLAGRAVNAQTDLVTVSGGGVNVKEMPSPDGQSMVPLRESFSVDAHYAQCMIEDNAAAFAMDTFAMGRVVIEPHSFFMAMYSNEMRLVSIAGGPGERVARLAGVLSCHTLAGTASVTLGSRTATEIANFEIVAKDAGPGGGAAGDTFAFTVLFNSDLAPVNYAIFGPNPTFTGRMVAGEITIAVPVTQPLQT